VPWARKAGRAHAPLTGQPRRLRLEDAHKARADALALDLRVGDAGQVAEKILFGVYGDQAHALVRLEGLDHLLRLAAPQQAMIHENTGQPVANGAVNERGGHRAVHAAAQPADDAALLAHLAADAVDRFGDEVARVPVAGAAADAAHKVGQEPGAVGRVHHLRVKLDAVEPPRLVGHRGQGGVGAVGDGQEAGRQLFDAVAVAHPDRQRGGQVGKERAAARHAARHFDGRRAVFAFAAGGHAPAQRVRQQLQPVADAQHRHAALLRSRLRAGWARRRRRRCWARQRG
jgi:hypothetical protein